MGRRAREAGYGIFFTGVFMLCQSPANSLAIDDIRVLSRLGEPLLAEVVVSPAAGEALNRSCFSTQRSSGGFPDIGKVRLTLTRDLNTTVLRIAGTRPFREPMSEFMLQVKCPGVPTMVKSFLVMVDPPTVSDSVPSPESLVEAAVPTIRATSPQQATAQRTRSAPASRRDPIQPASRYRVQSGDTLSSIAARVAGRPNWSVWPIAQHIYATNPGAFLLGDPNVIAEDAVIFIPRLSDVKMDRVAGSVRATTVALPPRAEQTAAAKTVDEQPATPARTVAQPQPVKQSQPESQPAKPGRLANSAQIMPTPTVTASAPKPVAVVALPAMQMTTGFFNESRIKLRLRSQGMPALPAVVSSGPAAGSPADTAPMPESEPEQPDNALNDSRAALQPNQAAGSGAGISWLWIVIGLLTGLLLGGLAAIGLLRRSLRRDFEHDVQEAVQRQVQRERLHAESKHADSGIYPDVFDTPADAASTANAFDEPAIHVEETTELPQVDHTVVMPAADSLDFEVQAHHEPAATGSPETLEMPSIGKDLDLELTAENGKTGQHEVDFELLEAAYSEDYQSEFVEVESESASEVDGESAADDEAVDKADDDESDRYYHLENRDPTDEAPLPIELGDDEMIPESDNESDAKVVRFRR